jgi:hypothetical protein
VHGLPARHRRKTGSGPPASALIAWIGADPILRSGLAATVSRRRETDLPPPASTHSARAAVVACFVLACGAVLGVTATVNDGLLAQRENSTPPVLDHDNAAAPDHGVPPVPSQRAEPGRVVSLPPAAMTPMGASGQALPPLAAPPGGGQVDQMIRHDASQPAEKVYSGPAAPPFHSTPRHMDLPILPHNPSGSPKPAIAPMTGHTGTLVDNGTVRAVEKLGQAGNATSAITSAGSGSPAGLSAPGPGPANFAGSADQASGNPAGLENPADPRGHADPSTTPGSGDPAGSANPGDSDKRTGDKRTGMTVSSSTTNGGDEPTDNGDPRAIPPTSRTPKSISSQRPNSTRGAISAGGSSAPSGPTSATSNN